MKKTIMTLFAAMTLMLSSCMTTGFGTAGTTSNTGSSSDILGSVLGAVLSNVLLGGQSGILGSWNYVAPTTAFTSEQTLTKAGGNAAIANINSSLASSFNSIGINSSNTSFSFLAGNKFLAKVNGIPFSGTYTYNAQNGEISLKTSTETIKGNVIKTQKGMGLMFNATQMANILQKRKPYLSAFGKPFISADPTVLADNPLILLNCFLSACHVPGQPRSRCAVRYAQG